MLNYIKKIFKMKEEIFNYFIDDLDSIFYKIIDIKTLQSNFIPSIVLDREQLPTTKLIDKIIIIDNYLH